VDAIKIGWLGSALDGPGGGYDKIHRMAFEEAAEQGVLEPILTYDTARVLVEGLARAPILAGDGVKTGLERIRFLPSTTGGPRTHIACSPHEHGMFRGDWLLYGRVRNGKLEFEGLFEPW
jgi:hypothetical protein